MDQLTFVITQGEKLKQDAKHTISILTASDFPYHGAAESFVRQLSLGLRHNKANIHIYRYWGNIYSQENDTAIKVYNYLFGQKPVGNGFLKIADIVSKFLYIPFFLYRISHKQKSRILIIYGLDYAFFLGPIMLLSKMFHISCFRIITDYRVPEYTDNDWTKRIKLYLTYKQHETLDKYFNGILVLSHQLKKMLIENHVVEKKILLIPHFIDMDIQKYSPRKRTPYRIGYCGNMEPKNGVKYLVEAFSIIQSEFRNAELILIGNDDAELKKQIGLLQNSNIHQLGLLNIKDVEKELRQCSVLVNPRSKSKWADAGFPTKIGEYFSTKTPVVSTKVGDLPKYMSDKNELLFAEPNSSKSLAGAIKYIFDNPSMSAGMGMNGYEWACANLEYRSNAQKFIDFIYLNVN